MAITQLRKMKNILSKFIIKEGNIVHTASIVREDVWQKLKEFIGRGYIWFVITPTSYEYCKSLYNIRLSKEEFTSILRNRIDILKKYNEEVQILIFLCNKKFLNNKLQEIKFEESIEFMKSCGINPNKFTVVKNNYNKYTLFLGKKHKLTNLSYYNPFIINPLLKILNFIKEKYPYMVKLSRHIKNGEISDLFHLLLGKLIKAKEKTIHIESIVRDNIWNVVKNKVIGKGYIYFVVTPSDYDYCKSYFDLRIDKKEFSDILRRRIKYLKDLNEEIQLHIHLCMNKKFLDNKLQEDKFKEAMEFFSSLGIKPKRLATGWWCYDGYTILLAKLYGIKDIFNHTNNPLIKFKEINDIKIKYIHKYRHDFEV